MKTIIAESEWAAHLAAFRGSDAQIWLYHVSHRRFALRLYRHGSDDALFIVGVGCTTIRGGFDWKSSDVRIVDDRQASGGWQLVDPRAGFALSCASVGMATGPVSELDLTFFDGFLGDAPPT